MQDVQILCIGGAVLDRKYCLAAPLQPATSNPACASQNFGGVARNVCENLARLGLHSALATRVGADAAGREIIDQLGSLGIDTSCIIIDPACPTAEYVAVLAEDGKLELGLAAMQIFDALDLADIWRPPVPAWVFADCNLPPAQILRLLDAAREPGVALAVDAVSVAKSRRLPADLTGLSLLFANGDEAAAMLGAGLPPREAALALRARGAQAVVVTMGADGLVLADAIGAAHFPAVPVKAVDVTGAGDALIAMCLARLIAGSSLAGAVRAGIEAAALTVACKTSVHPDLKRAMRDHESATESRLHD